MLPKALLKLRYPSSEMPKKDDGVPSKHAHSVREVFSATVFRHPHSGATRRPGTRKRGDAHLGTSAASVYSLYANPVRTPPARLLAPFCLVNPRQLH
jgi:hypothetical protein